MSFSPPARPLDVHAAAEDGLADYVAAERDLFKRRPPQRISDVEYEAAYQFLLRVAAETLLEKGARSDQTGHAIKRARRAQSFRRGVEGYKGPAASAAAPQRADDR